MKTILSQKGPKGLELARLKSTKSLLVSYAGGHASRGPGIPDGRAVLAGERFSSEPILRGDSGLLELSSFFLAVFVAYSHRVCHVHILFLSLSKGTL